MLNLLVRFFTDVYDLMSRAIRDVMKLAGDGITLSAVEVDSIGARTVHVCVCVCFDSFLFLFPCLFFLPRTQTSLATTSAKQPNSCKNYTRLKTKSNMYSITCYHSCRIYSKTTISCASTHSAPTNTTLAWVRML
jgi:hypothetical protein